MLQIHKQLIDGHTAQTPVASRLYSSLGRANTPNSLNAQSEHLRNITPPKPTSSWVLIASLGCKYRPGTQNPAWTLRHSGPCCEDPSPRMIRRSWKLRRTAHWWVSDIEQTRPNAAGLRRGFSSWEILQGGPAWLPRQVRRHSLEMGRRFLSSQQYLCKILAQGAEEWSKSTYLCPWL